MKDLSVPVPVGFQDYVDPLLVRMGFLFPELELSYDNGADQIRVRFDDSKMSREEIQKEIRFQLYREKIYQETLPIRKRLYGNG